MLCHDKMELIRELYWKIGAILIMFGIAVMYGEVLPFLQKRKKIGLGSWLINIRHVELVEIYGEHCKKEERSLIWYKFLTKARTFLICWIIGWLFLTLF